MTTYLRMWDGVKKMSIAERDALLEELRPATGRGVKFNGVECCDVDLIEALKNSH